MFRRLSRLIAVLALALAPVVGAQVTQAHNAAYPVWPSFEADGCNAQPGSGGTWIACGQGGYALTQVDSGYACNELDISVSAFNQGPFLITGTVDSGSQSNSVSVDGTGNYYMRFPGYLVNNLITLQISSPDSGVFAIGYISTSPCPVAPTATPVPPTDTPNPSDTPTPIPPTATPGPSQTPTAIPTYTPLPHGHSTFTPTGTPVPTNTATPAATATPSGPTELDCGPAAFPLLNCNLTPLDSPYLSPTYWHVAALGGSCAASWSDPSGRPSGDTTGGYNGNTAGTDHFLLAPAFTYACGWTNTVVLSQTVIAQTAGDVYFSVTDLAPNSQISNETAQVGSNTPQTMTATTAPLGHVNAGPVSFQLRAYGGGPASLGGDVTGVLHVSFTPDAPWTPAPTSTDTPPATVPPVTATAGAQLTETAIAASFTPTTIPIPGAQSTPVPTDTECPGGCAVAELTSITGIATRVGVDTSPFSALTHLSLARSSCQPFGYVQIPVPVIVGTPVLGSTTPLSVTWTVPVTHAWDDTNLITNTAIQPCAMTNEIPSFLWDLTYWGSVLGIAVVFTLWLIGFVGRISGDHTING